MDENSKISVVLVDDSAVIRGAISRILEQDPNIEIVGSASNGQMAVSMAKIKKPDIMILDVEMPIMDGLTALPKISENSPETKVIMCSSLTAKGADTTINALALGAVECIVKPSSAQGTGPGSPFQVTLVNLVKALSGKSNMQRSLSQPVSTNKIQNQGQAAVKRVTNDSDIQIKRDSPANTYKPEILAIGSSTGGPQALFQVIADLGPINIPIVITQHMPATFTKILAEHITQKSKIPAHEGEDGMIVERGHIYVAPGGKHMLFERINGQLKIKLSDGPEENFCKPAVDPMLKSLIEIYGNKALCVILTGMGQDGLIGASALSEAGGRIVAQDKETSVVWGMPGAVASAGICSAVIPLNTIGQWLKKAVA